MFGTLRSTNLCSSTPTVVMASLWSVSRFLRTQRSSQLLHRFHGTLTTARINHTDKEISFADHRATYAHLSASEILRAWFVLKLCSFDFVVQNSIKILEHSQRIVGQGFLEKILRPTLYDHFVAGDNPRSLKEAAAKLKNVGIRLMILPSLEEDVGHSSHDNNRYDVNTEITLQLADIASQSGGPLSCLQTKITALINANLMLKVAQRTEDKEVQFRTIESWTNYIKGGSFNSVSYLSKNENIELEKGLERLKSIGQAASARELRLLVDGEYTYLNKVISIVALAMAGAFNQSRPVVWNTYQCYLKEAYDKVCLELEMTQRLGVTFGAKIVRGAYLDRERSLSVEGNYPDPTNPSYEATTALYDRVVGHLMEQVAATGQNRCNMIVATHNEASVLKALSKMSSLGISPTDNTVVFGQIYGMAFNISVKLDNDSYCDELDE